MYQDQKATNYFAASLCSTSLSPTKAARNVFQVGCTMPEYLAGLGALLAPNAAKENEVSSFHCMYKLT